MNKKSLIRAMRKSIMKMGTITEEKVLNRDDNGNRYPKKEWGYVVSAEVNGYKITAPDDSKYEAYKGCLYCAQVAMEMPKWEPKKENENE